MGRDLERASPLARRREFMADEKQHAGEEARRKPSEAMRRKPYAKPAFSFEPVFETMALACGKAGSQHHCQIIKKRS